MPLLSLPPFGVNIVLIVLIGVAAIYDLRYRRVPNWLTLGGVLTGFALNSFLYRGWAGVKLSLTGLAAGFGVYMLLYVLRAMGAGDVKLMAAIGALVGIQAWFGIFVVTAIIGGFVGLALVTVRGRVRKTLFNVGFILNEMKSGHLAYVTNNELDVGSPKSIGLPHGAVIAAGTVLFLCLSARFR